MSYPPTPPPGSVPPDPSWQGPQQPYQAPNQPGSPPAGGYPTYQAPTYGYGAPAVLVPAQTTNGLAIASLVCSLAGLLTCGVTSLVGAILGHVARRQIRERGEGGDGLALAGIITGWVVTGLYVLIIIGYAVLIGWLVTNDPTFDPTPPEPYPS